MESPAPHQKPAPPRLALLACSVFEREIALLAHGSKHIVLTRWFEMGLHDNPDLLRTRLQEEIQQAEASADIDAVVLAYGLCGRGTAGLRAHRHPLVIPRAHDCITLFMGSKEAYAEHRRRCRACYYYTPGWNRNRRVPGPEKLQLMKTELAKKFEGDDVEFLLAVEREQWAQYNTATYLDLGTDDAEREAVYTKQCADWLGWKFERLCGDARLLRDLLWGRWDSVRFQIVEPGRKSVHSPDENIFSSASADKP